MYSKKSGRGTLPPRMPAHYNGWAFQPPPAPADPPPKPFGADRPQPPQPQNQEVHQSYPRPLPFLPPPAPKPPEERPLPPSFLPPAIEQIIGKSGFLRSLNLDFEELLLIGLIVLLGSGGEDSELPLLLALLLFC